MVPIFVPKLCKLIAAGETLTSAARQLGISKSAAHVWIVRYGTDAGRRTKPRLAPETRSEIATMRRQGVSVRATAATIGVSRDTVRRHTSAPQQDVYRCKDCGGKTFMRPCPTCAARAARMAG